MHVKNVELFHLAVFELVLKFSLECNLIPKAKWQYSFTISTFLLSSIKYILRYDVLFIYLRLINMFYSYS
jgi:hypothetical protein